MAHVGFAGLLGAMVLIAPNAHAAPSTNAGDDRWTWIVAPYLWASTIKTDLQEGAPVSGTRTDFKDIVDKLDFGFLGHVEGRGDRFGVFADVIYLDVSDSQSFPRVNTRAELDTTMLELAAVVPLGAERDQGFDVFAGLRYIDTGFKIEFDPVNPLLPTATLDHGESFSDFMLGARYTARLSDRWAVTLRGDGSWGDTDGAWNTAVVFQYAMKRGAWVFGYRYMEIELPTTNSSVDLTMYGPEVGYAFKF